MITTPHNLLCCGIFRPDHHLSGPKAIMLPIDSNFLLWNAADPGNKVNSSQSVYDIYVECFHLVFVFDRTQIRSGAFL